MKKLRQRLLTVLLAALLLTLAFSGAAAAAPAADAIRAVLSGKKVLFVGDSIAAGWRDEVNGNYTNAGGWATRIADAYGADVTLGAIAGQTLSDIRGNEKRIVNQIKSREGIAYDYVILQGGFNDAMGTNEARTKESAAPIGKMADGFALEAFDASTYAGGLEEALYYARQYFPDARVGYIITYSTPLSTYGGYTAEAESMRAYYAVGKQICDKWGVAYLDLYDGKAADGQSYSQDILKTDTTANFPGGSDCIHLNSAGYDAIYLYIAEWMAAIPAPKAATEPSQETTGAPTTTTTQTEWVAAVDAPAAANHGRTVKTVLLTAMAVLVLAAVALWVVSLLRRRNGQ